MNKEVEQLEKLQDKISSLQSIMDKYEGSLQELSTRKEEIIFRAQCLGVSPELQEIDNKIATLDKAVVKQIREIDEHLNTIDKELSKCQ